MAALVADYGSDSNNSEDTTDYSAVVETEGNKSTTAGTNLLMTRGDSTSSSEEDEGSQEGSKPDSSTEKLPNPMQPDKLPNPMADPNAKGLSVFSNPFEQAELAKKSVLEKHVRLTEAAPERGNRPVCFKFKKGKCHMGKNCRFFHDPNFASPMSQGEGADTPAKSRDAQGKPRHAGRGTGGAGDWASRSFQRTLLPECDDSDSYLASAKKKKRTGVADNLVPPKRAMMELQKQRSQERPWTLQK